MTEEKEQKKKRSTLSLVTRKSTKKMLGKWKKLESTEKDEPLEDTTSQKAKLFGLSLEAATVMDPSLDGIPIPAIFRQSLDYIEAHGMELEGIYRVSSPKSRLDELERQANLRADPINYDPNMVPDFRDAHEAAGLFKRYVRQLPESLMPVEIDALIERCNCDWRHPCTCEVASEVKRRLDAMVPSRRLPLAYMFLHCQRIVKHEPANKMGVPALGLLMQTILDMSRRAVCMLLANASPLLCNEQVHDQAVFFFEDVGLKPYVPPKRSEEVESWQCDDRPSIEEEINKQNNLLKHLHDQRKSFRNGEISLIDEGPAKKSAEERLWDVQQAVTTLRRRLRTVVKPTKGEQPTINRQSKELIYQEKQLLAVQSMLHEDIVTEQRRIAALCWQLILAGVQPFETKDSGGSKDLEKEAEFKEEADLEEAARTSLVDEICKLRTQCALLRANMEMVQQEAGPPTVTRF